MAAPFSGCRNSSFTGLCNSHEALKTLKPGVLLVHSVGLKRSLSSPSLTAKPANSCHGPSGLQRASAARTEACAEEDLLASRSKPVEAAYHRQQGHREELCDVVTATRADAAVQSRFGAKSPVTADGRFASLSRVLLVGQPGSMFRTLANRKWPSAIGPISLLVFLFGTVLALFAAVRGALVRKVKSCKCCKGFGVVRCRLCDGRGTVDWRAKFSYSETCPLCAAKRFVVCPDCGGHYHRRLFSHAKGSNGTLETFFPGTGSAGVETRSNPLD